MSQASTRKPATIYEIAQRAGVSSSTVARVLRGDVKETWKSTAQRADRIRKLAEEMGYRTNWRARAFSERKSWTMGLLYTRAIKIFDGVHAQIATGFNDQLRADGYHLLLLPVESRQFEEVVLGSRLDGCAMLMKRLPDDAADMLKQSGMPTVMLNSQDDHTDHRIEVDDFEGGFLAAEHLLELGHRRIELYVNESADPHYSIDLRRQGVNAALRKAGLATDDAFWQVSHNAMVQRVLDVKTRPTGLICYSHAEAIPMLSAMYEHQLRIPDAMSVLAFNDVYPAAVSSPPLTTLAYDPVRLGQLGAQMLLRQIEKGDTQDTDAPVSTLSHHLTVRASTGPVPGT